MTVPVTSLSTNDLEPPEDLEPLEDLDPLEDLQVPEDLEAPAGLQAPQSIESPVAEPLGAILEVSPAALPAESGSLGLEGPGAEVIETPQVARWFAVQVASSCEKKVKATLEQRAVTLGVDNRILEIEIPQTPGVKLKKDGSRQSIDEKVFPGYVLVRMILDEDTMMAVRSTPNVINFVGQEERRATGKARGHIRPRPLSRQEVDRIFKRAAEKKPVVKVDISEGDQILVTAGPFKDFQGEVIDVSGERNKLKALLSIFGRETPVELEFSQISKQN